ncbi:nuclear transport factor 2 family protein [Hwanghaeella sp.]|uniref:nuclear transport factor 2 family protein n=1 Tax=Hwanghaeella sp. TaxID=2605943 RepID=UPI003CCB7437
MFQEYITQERLLDREKIKLLKAQYCRFLDTKQWPELRSLFRDDASFEGFGSAPTGSTVDQFIAGISTRLTDALTVHHCHMPEITFDGPSRARAIWAMVDVVELLNGNSPIEAPGHRGFTGYGHYEDEYSLVDGEWKFAFKRLSRIRVDPIPNEQSPALTDRLKAHKNWIGFSE